MMDNSGLYRSMIQNINVSKDLGREELFELGKRGPYVKYVNFPVALTHNNMTTKRIKFGDVKINVNMRKYVNEVLDSNHTTMGPMTKRFEDTFSEAFNCKYSTAVTNGTDALICSFLSLYENPEVKRGDEILIPALSFISTCSSVIAAGFRPVLVEVSIDDMLIDVSKVEEHIRASRGKVRALVCVTLMGMVPEMDKLRELADRYKLTLIVDNAEGHGCKFHNQGMEKWADMSTYSLFSAHVLNSGQEFGVVTTDSERTYDLIRSIRSHGRKPDSQFFSFDRYGLNCKVTDISAAMALGALEDYNNNFIVRKYNLCYIRDRLAHHKDKAWFTGENENTLTSPHALSITLKKPGYRQTFLDYLESKNLEAKVNFGAYYIHKGYNFLPYKRGDFPNAEYCGDEGLHVGVHAGLSSKDLKYMISVIDKFLEST